MGKRERRAPPTNYNPITQPKKSMIVNNRKIKLPKVLRLPRMEDHQFYNRERLLGLSKLEFTTFATLKASGQLPPRELYEEKGTLLPDEFATEKRELLEEGFEDITRSQYFHFVKACAKFGRDDIVSIAADMELPVETVRAYGQAFWKYGPTELKKEEWERNNSNIEKGEAVSECSFGVSVIDSCFTCPFNLFVNLLYIHSLIRIFIHSFVCLRHINDRKLPNDGNRVTCSRNSLTHSLTHERI